MKKKAEFSVVNNEWHIQISPKFSISELISISHNLQHIKRKKETWIKLSTKNKERENENKNLLR